MRHQDTNAIGRARRPLEFLGVAAGALLAAGCGGDSRNAVAIRGGGGGAGGGAVAEKTIDPANSGTISGTVRWSGDKPKPSAIDVSGNPDCVKISKETIYDESIVVNDDDTVRNCFISIDSDDAYPPPAEAVEVDQASCHYIPHVFALMVGQTLKIKSSDPTSHNVHYIPMSVDNDEDNFAMPKPGSKDRRFGAPDKIRFKCDIHPWMGAWCHVKSHPFFSVTGDGGTYTIKNVPAGTHKLVLTHEKLGSQTVEVTVPAKGFVTQDFTLQLKQ
jgi:plastocyanin